MPNPNENEIKGIQKAYKPDLVVPIFTTLICSAPYFHLLLDIVDKDYSRLLFLAIISAPLIAYISIIWTRYFYNMSKYRDEVHSYLQDPEKYVW
ncbi:hypothetical protein KHA93_21360 [Bacillus sp. FJAT-49732]|uniref:Uncharacterized protein n=1 Tax=Lederbergia citrisecunda TaxID=2833583 RepID=A0A942YQD0_9BACI|nr:hypothetical protein [Lederbergia citrisecunda]MBS4202161.1 hypothetical protein [Lederbergia citrisecunda]